MSLKNQSGRKVSQTQFKICKLPNCNLPVETNGRNCQHKKEYCCTSHANQAYREAMKNG